MDWFEDEGLWSALYPVLFSREQWDAAETELDLLLELVGDPGRAVLDLCCGPGRHSLALARRGFRVTALDRTRHLVETGREKAAAAGLSIDWIVEDMREHRRPGSYDLILNLFTSFGYFDDPDDDLRVLRQALENLAPGGTLVLEMASKEWLAAGGASTTAEPLEDGRLLVKRCDILDDWSRIDAEWILIDGDRAQRVRFAHRIYSATEIKALLAEAGFREVRIHGDYEGSAFGLDARRIVALARRD